MGYTLSKGALRSPGVCLGLGVVVFALYLSVPATLLRAERDLQRSFAELWRASIAPVLIAWALFVAAGIYQYSAKQAAVSWMLRTLISGVLIGPVLYFLMVFSFPNPFGRPWLIGNLLLLLALYFLWNRLFGVSRIEAVNLAIAAMPLGLLLSFVMTDALISLLPRI